MTTKTIGDDFAASQKSRPHRVAALVYDGLSAFEFGIAAEIFGLSRPEHGAPLYEFKPISLENGPLRFAGGLTLQVPAGNKTLDKAQTIIIPGWRGKDIPVPQIIISSVQAAHKRGARILSICSGVYVLAAAGLLSGKTVTTHWRYADDLAEKYPDLKVDSNALYIQAGTLMTSAGSSAGIDACLQFVRDDYGSKIANSVARRLVMPAHRQGDQAQYIERPIPKSKDLHNLSALQDNIRLNLQGNHSAKSMAAAAGMSVRTFQRRFSKMTNLSPLKWLTKERIDQGRLLLETTELSVDEISMAVGFSSAEALRYHFRQRLGVSPVSYRKRFVQSVSKGG